MSKIGRNDPCSCGSGKKFKLCCGGLHQAPAGGDREALWRDAVQCYSQRQAAQALALCQRLLLLDARHSDAMHLLGVLAYDNRDYAQATRYVQAALAFSEQPSYHNTLCLVLTAAGRFDAAQSHGERALQLQPRYAEAHYNLGQVWQHRKAWRQAIDCYRHAIAINPQYALAHSSLGDALLEDGHAEQAIAAYEFALKLQPRFAEAHNNLGNAWRKHGDPVRAAACYRLAADANPALAHAHRNMASVHAEQGHWLEATNCYYNALQVDASFIDAHCELAAVLAKQGHKNEARARLKLAMALQPDSSTPRRCMGQWYEQFAQDFAAADHCYQSALRRNGADAVAYALLAGVHKRTGRLDAAVHHYRRSLEIAPAQIEVLNNLGTVLQELAEWEEAVRCYRRVLELDAHCAEAHSNLGLTHKQRGALRDAVQSLEQALRLRASFPEAWSNLGLVRELQGDVQAALHCYEQALALEPSSAAAYSVWLFAKSYAHDNDAQLARIASGFEQACVPPADRQVARTRTFSRTPIGGRRLRIGYLSGDFREHPVAFFIEPILLHHDRSNVEVFAYATHAMDDVVTERLRSRAEHWRTGFGLSDAQLRDRIDADGIDVLIDLSGHTAHNRLGVIARRAAPVQAHYLGYFATTGLREMDYWIGDEVLSPPDVAAQFVESLWRLPRVSVAYAGRDDLPVSCWQADSSGTIWLGSFNKLVKINSRTLRLWSDIMQALPQAKLLLKTKELADASNRHRIACALQAVGVAAERVFFDDTSNTRDWRDHMASYDRLDIALDPIGSWGGNTTTCDALWMGVPVITLLGATAPERMTAPMLYALGHPEWVAHSESEYIEKVVALARAVEHRVELRATQRDRMRQSPLCDAASLTRCLENAYREMHARACSAGVERSVA